VPQIGEAQVARGEEGCTAAFTDPVLVQQLTAHYTMAFVEHVLRGADTAALGPDAVELVPGTALNGYDAA
jgi:hypothetical protein